ncbi:hypothetical protein CAEBREN_16496 [Caenorhabditis brenneri]|uniref:DUF7809 domain-containing protein n=1 Tax=Caenorhabditis brenneri TaxID=135651 RepID=G0PLE9_CAEBE|nr:hypothetical protein CAEBREN_16496 [Caenorhabditis brenneri]
MVARLALQAKESVVGACAAYLPQEHWHLIRQHDDGGFSLDPIDPILEMYGDHRDLFKEILKFRRFPGSHKLFDGGLTELLTTEETVFCNAAKQTFIYKQDYFQLVFELVMTANPDTETDVMPMISYYIQGKEKELNGICELYPYKDEKIVELQGRFNKGLTTRALKTIRLAKNEKTVDGLLTKFKEILPKNDDDPEYAAIRKLIESHVELKPVKKFHTYYEDWINRVAISIQILEGFIAENPEIFQLKTEGPAIVRVLTDRDVLVMTHELLSEMRKAGMDCEAIEKEIVESPALSTWDFDTVQAKLGDLMENIEFVFSPVKRTRHRAIYIPTIDGGYCIPAGDAFKESFHYMMSVKCVFQQLGEWPGPDAKDVLDFCEDIVEVLMEDFHGTRFINVKQIAELHEALEFNFREFIQDILDTRKMAVYKISNRGFSGEDVVMEMERFGYLRTCPGIERYAEPTVEQLKRDYETDTLRTWHMYMALERCMAIGVLGRYPSVEHFFHLNKMCTSLRILCRQCQAAKNAAEEESKENAPPSPPAEINAEAENAAEEEAKENALPSPPAEITGKESTED